MALREALVPGKLAPVPGSVVVSRCDLGQLLGAERTVCDLWHVASVTHGQVGPRRPLSPKSAVAIGTRARSLRA